MSEIQKNTENINESISSLEEDRTALLRVAGMIGGTAIAGVGAYLSLKGNPTEGLPTSLVGSSVYLSSWNAKSIGKYIKSKFKRSNKDNPSPPQPPIKPNLYPAPTSELNLDIPPPTEFSTKNNFSISEDIPNYLQGVELDDIVGDSNINNFHSSAEESENALKSNLVTFGALAMAGLAAVITHKNGAPTTETAGALFMSGGMLGYAQYLKASQQDRYNSVKQRISSIKN